MSCQKFDHLHLQWFAEEPEEEDLDDDADDEEEQALDDQQQKAGPALRPWMAQLPDRYKQHDGLAKFQSIGELAESWEGMRAQLDKFEGQASAPDLPETPEGYQVTIPKMPESMSGREYAAYRKDLGTYLEATAGEIKQLCHGLKLPNEAAQKVAELFAAKNYEAVQAAVDQQAKAREEGLTALKQKWKGDFAARQELARRAVHTFGGQDLVPHLKSCVHEFGNLLSYTRYADLARTLCLTTLSYSILVRHSKACSALTL